MKKTSLVTGRIESVDTFRGITIFIMVFVNELAGVQAVPAWMKHMPADADAMTFVDLVFPAFLFIVGMSIPFAINNRFARGETRAGIMGHVLLRVVGLLTLGIFMVNAEGVHDLSAMAFSIHLWSVLFFLSAVLVWMVYPSDKKNLGNILRVAGLVSLFILGVIFRGGDEGTDRLTPQWWGILGLIGWAYLIGSSIYLLSKGNKTFIFTFITFCIVYYGVGHFSIPGNIFYQHYLFNQGGHATHGAIVMCGMLLSLIYFGRPVSTTSASRIRRSLILAGFLFIVGYLLQPYFGISKIYATPTWGLYAAGICMLLYVFLNWVVEVKNNVQWTRFFRPAAVNPLLTYMIPFFIYAIMHLIGISFPGIFYEGAAGIMWSLVYSTVVIGIAGLLTKLGLRLHL